MAHTWRQQYDFPGKKFFEENFPESPKHTSIAVELCIKAPHPFGAWFNKHDMVMIAHLNSSDFEPAQEELKIQVVQTLLEFAKDMNCKALDDAISNAKVTPTHMRLTESALSRAKYSEPFRCRLVKMTEGRWSSYMVYAKNADYLDVLLVDVRLDRSCLPNEATRLEVMRQYDLNWLKANK